MSRKPRFWSKMTDEEIVHYYRDNYDGMTNTELREADCGLLAVMEKRRLQHAIRKKPKPYNAKWVLMSDEEVVQYYNEHHEGVTRGNLWNENGTLATVMSKRGLMDAVPAVMVRRRKQRNWSKMSDDEMIRFYKDNYSGVTRGRLGNFDQGFAGALRKRGLMENIPMEEKRDWSSMSDEDMEQFYKDNFGGMTRHELWNKDSSFHSTLRTRGLLGIVPTKKGEYRKRRNWKKMTDEELMDYYRKHYGGIRRTKLRDKDPNLYANMRERKLLSIVPILQEHRDWQSMSDDEVAQYYKDNFDGMGREELKEEDSGLFRILENRKLLHIIPYQRKPKINTPEKLAGILDTDDKARYAIELAHGDDVDFADIMAVLYEGRITRKDVLRFTEEPSIRDYLGHYQKPEGISGIIDPAEEILPLDRNGVLRGIVYKRLIEYRREYLGTNPSPEQRTAFMDDLKREMGKLGGVV